MTDDRPFVPAVLLLFLAGLLHLSLLALPGPAGATTVIVAAIVLVALALGLRQGWRWLGYVAFLGALGAGIAALGLAVADGGPQSHIAWGILGSTWLAAATLFLELWAPPPSEFDV